MDSELKNIFSAEILYLKEDMDTLTGLQREFLSLIQNKKDLSVELYAGMPSIDVLENYSGHTDFFKGYGSFNEASYVANDILSKKLPFGSVTVLYSAQSQLPAISSALLGNGLAAKFVTDYPAQNNAYISLARRIIAWANDDFSEKALEKILSSSVVCAEVDYGTGTKINALASHKYFDHVLSAAKNDEFILGWGYKRNLKLIESQARVASTDTLKSVLKLHSELIEIFGVRRRQRYV